MDLQFLLNFLDLKVVIVEALVLLVGLGLGKIPALYQKFRLTDYYFYASKVYDIVDPIVANALTSDSAIDLYGEITAAVVKVTKGSLSDEDVKGFVEFIYEKFDLSILKDKFEDLGL